MYNVKKESLKEKGKDEKGMQLVCFVVISRDESKDSKVEMHTSTNDDDPTVSIPFSFTSCRPE